MRRLALAFVTAVALPYAARAQDASRAASDSTVCLGFAFGPWTPNLDWRAVGHDAPGSIARDSTAEGRDRAAPPEPNDSTLMLMPRWWPAGVIVQLPTRTPAPGDTITGRAVALVPR